MNLPAVVGDLNILTSIVQVTLFFNLLLFFSIFNLYVLGIHIYLLMVDTKINRTLEKRKKIGKKQEYKL